MSLPQFRSDPPDAVLDLTATQPLVDVSARLEKAAIPSPTLDAIRAVTGEESPRRRMPQLTELFRKAEAAETADFLRAAGTLAIRRDASGLRFLFGFLEVKRPGVEVLRQLAPLASLRRVSLRLISGSWADPEESSHAEPIFALMEALQEAVKVGILVPVHARLPRRSALLQVLLRQIRLWFARTSERLESGQTLEEKDLNFITQLAMLEISMMEKRVSRLAGTIDPYDARAIARLMPILSFYDQDIEHLKNVVSRLATYTPFRERLLTMENALSSSEMDRIENTLRRDAAGAGLARVIGAVRRNPVLDREFAFLVSVAHQIATLRCDIVDRAPAPDLLSVMLDVLEHAGYEGRLVMGIEPDAAEMIWPVAETWDVMQRSGGLLTVQYREDRGLDFVLPDGTPRLPKLPAGRAKAKLTIRDLVQIQMNNDPFLLGILENPRASSMPGVVPLIATQCRSVGVLCKIIDTRRLHSGPANKDVPRLVLQNPTRVPIRSLKTFIHVQYVSRIDLERLARSGSEVRPEVRQEIQNYLQLLKK